MQLLPNAGTHYLLTHLVQYLLDFLFLFSAMFGIYHYRYKFYGGICSKPPGIFFILVRAFYCFNQFVMKLKSYKAVTAILWIISRFYYCCTTLITTNKDNLFYVKRPFKMDVMETGFQFGWQRR